jgi:hypothetical protein
VLGGLCRKDPKGHEWGTIGKSLRRKNNTGHAGNCICCKKRWNIEEALYRQKIITQTQKERLAEQLERSSVSSEEWRDIKGYEGEYEVSSFGNVRSIKNNKILKPSNKKGYQGVCFWIKGMPKAKRYLVHRLVATAFISDPPTPQHQVNHIDGNPSNNYVSNLEWVTPLENTRHSIEVLKVCKINSGNFQQGSKHNASKLTEDDVKWILDNQEHLTCKEMSVELGVSVALINDICLRRRWLHITSWYGLSE